MKLIIGLGNPGEEYTDTRHNIGFLVVQELAARLGVREKKDRLSFSLTAKGSYGRRHVVLARPYTYMNLSGVAARTLMKHHRIALQDMLVVCDDLDLDFSRLKIKAEGSAAGHRGLRSVCDAVGTRTVARLRVGIGRSETEDAAEYVLSRFSAAEHKVLAAVVARAADCCELWVTQGMTAAMNEFNRYRRSRNESV